ncbi:hypothetical protein INT45_000199 [Circinella minor]|uniref:Uncharacterized protein n=1 Tax=Circinella minor TaxID=1195481 RepID=A0A8H7VFP4_9FUNG|nr:hypothetical protein INT45_000199 [Circinella minor]
MYPLNSPYITATRSFWVQSDATVVNCNFNLFERISIFLLQAAVIDDEFQKRKEKSFRILETLNETGEPHELQTNYEYFQQKRDAVGVSCFSTLQRASAVMQMLAYGGPADAVNEYFRMAPYTVREALKEFCRAIIRSYGKTYLRSPNEEDLKRILAMNEGTDAPSDSYSVAQTEWLDGSRSDMLYASQIETLPPILIECQYHVNQDFMLRVIQYSSNVYRRYKMLPIVLAIVTKSFSKEKFQDEFTTSKDGFLLDASYSFELTFMKRFIEKTGALNFIRTRISSRLAGRPQELEVLLKIAGQSHIPNQQNQAQYNPLIFNQLSSDPTIDVIGSEPLPADTLLSMSEGQKNKIQWATIRIVARTLLTTL